MLSDVRFNLNDEFSSPVDAPVVYMPCVEKEYLDQQGEPAKGLPPRYICPREGDDCCN